MLQGEQEQTKVPKKTSSQQLSANITNKVKIGQNNCEVLANYFLWV